MYLCSSATHIPPGSAHDDKIVASCFVVCTYWLCVCVCLCCFELCLPLCEIRRSGAAPQNPRDASLVEMKSFKKLGTETGNPSSSIFICFSFAWRPGRERGGGPMMTRLSLHSLSSALVESVCLSPQLWILSPFIWNPYFCMKGVNSCVGTM